MSLGASGGFQSVGSKESLCVSVSSSLPGLSRVERGERTAVRRTQPSALGLVLSYNLHKQTVPHSLSPYTLQLGGLHINNYPIFFSFHSIKR